MSLLELDHVSKSYGRPPHERRALEDVSLELDCGETAAVWGMRRSGRSTLLRVAAGVEAPDEGSVRLEGHDLRGRGSEPLRAEIAYCRKLDALPSASVFEELIKYPLSCGFAPRTAARMLRAALGRAGAADCAKRTFAELEASGRLRVQIAGALLRRPKLIVADEPTLGLSLREREELIALLRELADDGLAILYSTDNATGFLGADRALTIDRGRLAGQITPKLAEVIPLRKLA
jgi:ABC-type multidrug transport system ATPase subunit